MTSFVIPIDNQLSYRSIPRNAELKYNITNHCDFPSRVLVVDWRGNCFVCACEAWLPISVGNIIEFQKFSDIWQTETAVALQNDINQKKFTHCAVDRCGIMYNNQRAVDYTGRNLTDDDCYYVSINIDESCNLRCPSCRKDSIMLSEGPEYQLKLQQVNHLVDLLENFDQPTHIVMSGNGDPLASSIMRPLLHRYRPKHNHTIRLFTNGLLLEKQLKDNPIVNHITQYFISIDAGSADVYHRVRLGGRWDQLRKNFNFLRDLAAETKAHVLLKFVLQKENYSDMENFANLCDEYGFSGVINRLEDWGTWDSYQEQDVIGNAQHTEHLAALDKLYEIYDRHHPNITFNPSLISICQQRTR